MELAGRFYTACAPGQNARWHLRFCTKLPHAMNNQKLAKTSGKLAEPYRIAEGERFRLKDFDPADTGKLHSKEAATEMLDDGVKLLSRMQEKLYAQDRYSLLIVMQAMDAAGKDGAIKHVMSGVNPQGCDV